MPPVFRKYNKIITYLVIIYNLSLSYAYDCSSLGDDIASGQATDPRALACVLTRIVYLFVMFGGAVLLYMILYGAFKLSMAQGDPKGFLGAQKTWLYAFIGFVVVVGFFAIYTILAKILGLATPDPNFLYFLIEQGMQGILDAAGVVAK